VYRVVKEGEARCMVSRLFSISQLFEIGVGVFNTSFRFSAPPPFRSFTWEQYLPLHRHLREKVEVGEDGLALVAS